MIGDGLKQLWSIIEETLAGRQEPKEVTFPKDHPLSGQRSGWLIHRHGNDENGNPQAGFEFVKDERPQMVPFETPATTVISHQIQSVASLKELLLSHDQCVPFLSDIGVIRLHDLDNPAVIKVMMQVERSASFTRWTRSLDADGRVKLTQAQFADMLLENIDDLPDDTVARIVSSISTSRTVTFETDDNGNENMTAKWGQKADTAGALVKVPRAFAVNLKPWVGGDIWEIGKEPAFLAKFNLRVKCGPDGKPVYDILWANKQEWNILSLSALRAQLDKVLDEPVMMGVPSAKKFIVP